MQENSSWSSTLALLGRLGSQWGTEQLCGCRAVWMAAARSWGVGLPAVQLTAIPAPCSASAVLGPMAANCRDNISTLHAQAHRTTNSTTDQLRLKICSIRSRPSMQLLSNDSGKMSIYLPSTNTGALSLKEQGKVRGILISCSLVQETTPHTIASLRENLSQWRWGKHSR